MRSRVEAWTELLRLPALFTVPGDVLAGAAATGARSDTRTLLAIGSSLCLYEAGMALNDWADHEEDAAERPHRPLPSGRIRPAAALTAACGLTATGLALAARAGRPAVAVAVPLAATVWAYDLALKHTPAGPLAMATARGLDLLLGAAATGGDLRPAVPSAALLGTHTLAVTAVSRGETRGGSSLAPLAALATTGLLARLVAGRPIRLPAGRRAAAAPDLPGPTTGRPDRGGLSGPAGGGADRGGLSGPTAGGADRRGLSGPTAGGADRRGLSGPTAGGADRRGLPGPTAGRPGHRDVSGLSAAQVTAALTTSLAAVYAATAARPYFHAALNPSPPLTQRAVGGGIRATIPLQAALTARAGGPATALLIAALAPLGRRFARKVSIT
ncbi:SCO3242 family prenyltransferase [Streptomyces sp. NPDC053750]|uniref:SCO3242 family prenyltransferase n=1 Tax=Streptomyces sp. NPDC053750 TaxID=3365714 RepID=UPI0037D6E9F8